MNTFDDVMLDRALLSLLDGAEVDWTDDVPDLSQEWALFSGRTPFLRL